MSALPRIRSALRRPLGGGLAVAGLGAAAGLGWLTWPSADGAPKRAHPARGGALGGMNGQWPAKLSHALWSERNGKLSLDHAVTATRAGARYALATMLVVARRTNVFSASVGYTREVWWPEYATAASLGRPLGGYRVLPDGVYRRDFSHGVVLVNPGLRRTRRIRLGGTYSGSGLRRVKAVSLERTSGLVLAGH